MHICLATSEFPPFAGGGISTYYGGLAQVLADEGHRVTVLTVGADADKPPLPFPGIEVIRLDRTVNRRFESLQSMLEPAYYGAAHFIAIALAMRDWLRSYAVPLAIDVVDVPEYRGIGAFLLDDDLPAVVLTCHASWGQVVLYDDIEPTDSDRLIFALEQISLGSADEIICYSQQNRDHWERYTGRTPILVTAPLIQYQISDPPASDPAIATSPTGVVVGRLQSWKGPLETMEALRICAARNDQVRIHWIGRDTPTGPGGVSMRDYLERNYADLWGRCFTWAEFLPPEEVRQAQRNAQFVLVPSRWDTFNYTAVEAMALGTPVIISSGAGASYVCESEKNSIVIPPKDPPALAQAIHRLTTDAALRRNLGDEGRRTVQQVFEPGRVASEHLDVFKTAMIRKSYRRSSCHMSSVTNPFVLLWARSVQYDSVDSLLERVSGRQLLIHAGRRLPRRLGIG